MFLGKRRVGFGKGRRDLRGFYRLGGVEMKGFAFMNGFKVTGAFKELLGLFVLHVSCPRSSVCDMIHGLCITTRVLTCRAV